MWPLKWLLTSTDTLRKMERWQLCLLERDFEVVHEAGIKHQAPDALSTVKIEEIKQPNIVEKRPVCMIDETEEQQDTKTKHFDHQQPDKEQLENHMDGHGIGNTTADLKGTVGGADKWPQMHSGSIDHWIPTILVHV